MELPRDLRRAADRLAFREWPAALPRIVRAATVAVAPAP